MSFETLTGLEVTDPAVYEQYRKAMKPILEKFGGGFRYDFWIKETLHSDSPNSINRIFAIYFKDKASKERFFSDPEYIKIRETYFQPSVKSKTVIAEYER